MTIILPEALEEALQREAVEQRRSIEEHAIALLQNALHITATYPTPEDVVAQIKAAGPNPHSLRPAQSSLADYLRNAPGDTQFNLDQWNKEWAAVEKEMRAMTHANDAAEAVDTLHE